MATVSDLTKTPLSGQNYIDALLDSGPGWNYMLPAGNTIKYTFSIASGNEEGKTGQEAFSAAQQVVARGAFAYLAKITGIRFVETAAGTDAQIHLANFDIASPTTTGLCSWQSPYSYDPKNQNILTFAPQAWVYLDSVEWRAQSQNLTPGGAGYETLLHELGHALGLKHPFETNGNTVTLPTYLDNTSYTLMSYTHQGGPYQTYNQDDIAALKWLYGGDGLGGALGINSTTGGRYLAGSNGADVLAGTDAADALQGDGGNDILDGGAGIDTAVFKGLRSNYLFTELANGDLTVTDQTGADGTDTLKAIEMFKFNSDSASGSITATRADVLNVPGAPTLNVSVNANGYAAGNTPIVTGGAHANATITLYDANHKQIGTTKADANGIWSIKLGLLQDGAGYGVSATETDATGNVSPMSKLVTFNIDTVAPLVPNVTPAVQVGDNQITFSGTGESGTTVMLVLSDEVDLASAPVVNGKWSVTTSALPNGDYSVTAVSVDKADNSTSGNAQIPFKINSPLNIVGTDGSDKLSLTAGNNAVTGGAGVDTVVVDGDRANYTVTKEIWGYDLVDKSGTGGHDHLIDVERLQFKDGSMALDIDGNAGQLFRLYQAAFDRVPDLGGLGFWIWRMDNGSDLRQVASEFLKQVEFVNLYGANPTDAEFVSHLYQNVLHRAPDQGGYDYWMNMIESHQVTRDQALAFFSESPENQAAVIGSIENGFAYTLHP